MNPSTEDHSKYKLDEALADVKAGRTTTFTSPSDLFNHIHQLEDSVKDEALSNH